MNIKLKNQDKEEKKIKPFTSLLMKLLDDRKPVWDKMDAEQREKWLQSGKDILMGMAYNLYKYLDIFFRGVSNG